ncbi:MAG: hypothetical protein QIT35_gp16 [Methanophagales virus PBV299]|uniref:DOD-type homing endonuclease domain-containing protein n=1 Tax=Methanophagales virus PBV299 TaxID=2987730 RepID=A0ABY6GN11_9CAUD|nr:MAG: hypothetical protein QIT35_gp16 [Methanophagales virus PBV299]UYL64812.1 MAG: hypothetical protein OFDIEDLO_00016 [Methanophagales virus PBV299]
MSKESVRLVEKYISEKTWRVRENANRVPSIGGTKAFIAETIIARYALSKVYPKEIARLHKDGFIHIHDLGGALSVYCVGLSLSQLLLDGLYSSAPQTIASRPPRHFSSAMGMITNYMGLLAQEAAGAISITNVDTLLAPYIARDKLSYHEIRQALQQFIYSINLTTRWGQESPFTNWMLDLVPPRDLVDTPVIIDDKEYGVYGDYQEEQNMFNEAFLELLMMGDGLGRPFTFPIPTFNITSGMTINEDVEALLFSVTANYGLPYFQNCITTELSPETRRAMCCFKGDTKVYWRKNGRVHYTDFNGVYKHAKGEEIETLFNGSWVKCRVVKVPYERDFYKIRLRNGQEIVVTDDHLHLTRMGLKKTIELTTYDYLAWSKEPIEWDGEVGDYDFGYFLGLYLAEGSYLGKNAIQFSIGIDEEDIKSFVIKFARKFGAHVSVAKNTGESLSLFINATWIRDLIESWIGGTRAPEKYLKNWVKLSKEALRGLWDGLMRGDGNNGKEIYTTSERLAQDLTAIGRLLGYPIRLRIDKHYAKFGEKEYRGKLYTIFICKDSDEGGRIYFAGGSLYSRLDCYWVKIESIERIKAHTNHAFCFEVYTDDHLFELPSGLITHNCRLSLRLDEIKQKYGGLWGSSPQTGSIGVITLSLPMIAAYSKSESEFFELLEDITLKALDALTLKRKIITDLWERGMYPYSRIYLPRAYETFFQTIGVVGGEEMCRILLGVGIRSQEGLSFTKEVLLRIREIEQEYGREHDVLVNLEETPAEGASYRLARLLLKKAPKNKKYVQGTSKAPYLTNSTHIPVNEDITLEEALKHQEQLQTIYTGGTVFLVFSEKQAQFNEVRDLIYSICNRYEIPYIAYTPTFSICPVHGYQPGRVQICPRCGKECLIYSRVVGYYRPVVSWNEGKQQEFIDRKPFDFSEFYKKQPVRKG